MSDQVTETTAAPKRTRGASRAQAAPETAVTSGAAAEGGGAWPPELLAERYIGARVIKRPIEPYTSHEK